MAAENITISKDLYDILRRLVMVYARDDIERKKAELDNHRYLLNVLKDIASLDGSGSLSMADQIFVVTSARSAIKRVEG
jgi:hypothetical protein